MSDYGTLDGPVLGGSGRVGRDQRPDSWPDDVRFLAVGRTTPDLGG